MFLIIILYEQRCNVINQTKNHHACKQSITLTFQVANNSFPYTTHYTLTQLVRIKFMHAWRVVHCIEHQKIWSQQKCEVKRFEKVAEILLLYIGSPLMWNAKYTHDILFLVARHYRGSFGGTVSKMQREMSSED